MSTKAEKLIGKKIGRLTVIGRKPDYVDAKGRKRTMMECVCECGTSVVLRADSLNNGHTTSCGCLQRERAAETGRYVGAKSKKYGESRERLHNIWYLMKYRCENTQSPAYARYGGRGIKVCSEWNDGISGYFAFKKWALHNGYSDTLTLDRIDNNGDYQPSNCRWVGSEVQNNNKRNNIRYEYNGKSLTVFQFAREYGLPPKTLWRRLHYGWSLERALSQPIRKSANDTEHT